MHHHDRRAMSPLLATMGVRLLRPEARCQRYLLACRCCPPPPSHHRQLCFIVIRHSATALLSSTTVVLAAPLHKRPAAHLLTAQCSQCCGCSALDLMTRAHRQSFAHRQSLFFVAGDDCLLRPALYSAQRMRRAHRQQQRAGHSRGAGQPGGRRRRGAAAAARWPPKRAAHDAG